MNTKFWFKLLLVFLAVAGMLILFSRRERATPAAGLPPSPTQQVRIEPPPVPMASDASPSTSAPPAPEAVLQLLSKGINRFIANARPFGVESAIRPEDITWVRTNNHGRSFLAETKTHLYEVQGESVAFYISNTESTDFRRDPTARSRWYQASGAWTKEEALKETHAIMDRLGIKATEESVEYRATPFPVKNPAGETVEVTPFHTVWLQLTNGVIEAQYRMGTSGPGRLVRWFRTVP